MAVETLVLDYKNRLAAELHARRERRPGYSLRAFARDLRVSPATLSQVINRKRELSRLNFLGIAERLSFSPLEVQAGLTRISGVRGPTPDEDFITLEDDIFHYMSDWYYFAIMSLAGTKRAKADPAWIGERLGISTNVAKQAVLRLKRLQLIEINKTSLVPLAMGLRTKSDVPSRARRKLQHDHLHLAARSLENDSIDVRDMTSMTMAIRRDRIPKAKTMIASFRRRLARFLEDDGQGPDVYVFSMQLFPVTKEIK